MISRDFLKPDFTITCWDDLKPFLDEIEALEIDSPQTLENMLKVIGELYEKISEDFAWTYINMTRDTNNEEYVKKFKVFSNEISPKFEQASFSINRKIVDSGLIDKIDNKYKLITDKIKSAVELFREKNLPLKVELTNLASSYQQLSGSMTVKFRDEEYTVVQMAKFLKDKDRDTRKAAYETVLDERRKHRDKINEIFDKMLPLRQEMAKNAGFDNYRDFRFRELDRTDYTADDCKVFHDSVVKAVVPVYKKVLKQKAEKLGLEQLKPYDKSAPADSEKTLVPFETVDEFINKTIEVFTNVNPDFGNIIKMVNEKGQLDLENRKGKAPGGYNYPLMQTGLPFIFMNAIKLHSDMRTLMHEGGHAVHAVATKDQFPYFYKSAPSEVAELASMAMELITMDNWNIFYSNEDELKQAKKEQLEGIIMTLPWLATIDKFQHWLYENPGHSVKDREDAFEGILMEMGEDTIDWSGYEDQRRNLWQRQIHIFEVPFYYIEYAFAQLGALQIWRNYLSNKDKAIEDYYNALKLGSSKTIPEVYAKANIKFDFSENTMHELMEFLFDQYEKML